MKYYFLLMALGASLHTTAQQRLTPAQNSIEKKWIQDETYSIKWLAMRDTTGIEIGTIKTIIHTDKQARRLYITQQIQMKQQQPKGWVDSTIVSLDNFSPIYHSSYNTQRDMVLRFDGNKVTGYYMATGKTADSINDVLTVSTFDSNVYPHLLRWLPLQNGYTATLPIYDYNQEKHGVVNAFVKNTEAVNYTLANGTTIKAWKLTVQDEIGAPGATVYYYIDQQSRQLLNMDLDMGPRKMKMIRVY
jgi:hypothetical protein